MRIVWSTRPTDLSIAIAAQIFVAAGVILVFIVNIIFAQRIIRATHPRIGWTKAFSWAFKLTYVCIVLLIVAVITCTVQSFYTLSTNTRRIDRDVQLVVMTALAAAAFLPIPLILLSIILPRRTRVEKFGVGRFRTKVLVLLFSSTILSLGASFRAGTGYEARPANDPAWYDSKACFYLFNFTIEITVVYLYAVIRVDKRFHVPNKSRGPGDYSRVGQVKRPEQSFPESEKRPTLADRVLSEEEVFDDQPSRSSISSLGSTYIGTPVEKYIDAESGIVTPVLPMSKIYTQENSRRWSVHTLAEIDYVLLRPDPTLMGAYAER